MIRKILDWVQQRRKTVRFYLYMALFAVALIYLVSVALKVVGIGGFAANLASEFVGAIAILILLEGLLRTAAAERQAEMETLLLNLEGISTRFYELSEEARSARDQVWHDMANVFNLISDDARYEVVAKLNELHMGRLCLAVTDAKRMLAQMGHYDRANGFDAQINPPLLDAIRAFQMEENMDLIDGIIGPYTCKRMKERTGPTTLSNP